MLEKETELVDIHRAFTDINKIFNSINFKNLNVSTREAFIIPILKKLQGQSFEAGKKEIIKETINELRRKL